MKKFRTFRKMSHTDLSDWKEFKGLGIAKVAQIKAALEIGRRFREQEAREIKPQIRSAKDVFEIMLPRMRDLKKEVFKVLMLDAKNRLIDVWEAAEGTVNHANPIIRELFHRAMQSFAAGVICVHNHPSGDIQPSKEDREFTQKLSSAGDILQISMLDHIIIGENGYFSFAEADMSMGNK